MVRVSSFSILLYSRTGDKTDMYPGYTTSPLAVYAGLLTESSRMAGREFLHLRRYDGPSPVAIGPLHMSCPILCDFREEEIPDYSLPCIIRVN